MQGPFGGGGGGYGGPPGGNGGGGYAPPGGGGYGGPPHGGPPGGGGYGGPPQGGPPGGGGYGPPGGGGYGGPPGGPGGGGYGPPGGGHGGPPQGFGAPPPGGFGAPPGFASPPGFGGPPGARAPVVKMSGGTYIALYVLCTLSMGALFGFAQNPSTTEATYMIPLPMLVLGVLMMVFIYKMWAAIDDGQTKPGPGAALGLLFVPFFSIYWMFVVLPGYATAYNAYIQRHRIQTPPLGMGLFLCAMLLSWIPLVGLVLWLMVFSTVTKAVNALSTSPAAA